MANMFNEDGTYNKTEWKAGDRITAVKLNKIESSLEAINNNDIDRHVEADSRLDILEERMANTPDNAQMDALEYMVKDNKAAVDLAVYGINQKIESLESVNADSRLDSLEGVNADSRLDALENMASNIKKINALDLNVKNDGSDTTMELQSAINYCRERRYQLYMPSGTYFITDTIVIGSYSKIIGDGKEHTIIKTDREIDMFILNTSAENGSYGIEISNIKLNGGKTANTGFYLFLTRESTLCDVGVTDCKCGIKLNQAWSNSIISSRIIYNDINLLLGDQTNDLNLIDDCFDSALENAIHITGDSQVINLTGCAIQNSVGNGILLDAGRSVNINSCYFENNNKNENVNSYDVNIRGEKQRVQAISISGCGFWCKKVSGAIFVDRGNSITITGGYVLPMDDNFDGYAVDASSNARDVYIFNLYKELASNNGEIFDISKPKFRSNISISKDYPTLTIDTTTEYHDPIVSFSTNGESTAMLTTYGDTFRILSRKHTTGEMEEIFSIHDDNLYARFRKNILLLNGSGITGANDINSKIYYFTDVARSQVSNNSIFVDESDGVLKYKDKNGEIKKISLE